jgi:succinyl-CoA synthetase beta subunit
MLKNTLVTKQSGAQGKPCNTVYIVEQVKMARELYVAILLDRARACPVLICSSIGGMGIEEIDKKYIKTFEINPSEGITDETVRKAVEAFDVPASNKDEAERVIRGLYKCFSDNESTLVEVNPLALLEDGRLLVCDTKVRIDDNSAFRNKALFAIEDLSQKEASEVEAESWELNYVKLDGNIGCMVNGAGLAMGTMDFIKFMGAEPANFLDVGGTATVDRVFEAIKIINSDVKVTAILVNIFGGIVRCDVIVEGVIKAMRELHIKKPIVVRIKGTNADIVRLE